MFWLGFLEGGESLDQEHFCFFKILLAETKNQGNMERHDPTPQVKKDLCVLQHFEVAILKVWYRGR